MAKISDSEWDSKLGGSEKGYNMNKIKWNDLGRKYIVTKGKKSMIPHANESVMQESPSFQTVNNGAALCQEEP